MCVVEQKSRLPFSVVVEKKSRLPFWILDHKKPARGKKLENAAGKAVARDKSSVVLTGKEGSAKLKPVHVFPRRTLVLHKIKKAVICVCEEGMTAKAAALQLQCTLHIATAYFFWLTSIFL
jgi:hypothetical protein